jgi:hypothetical protein
MAQLTESTDGGQTTGVDRGNDENAGRVAGGADAGAALNPSTADVAATDRDRRNARRPLRGTLPGRSAKKHVILFLAANPSGTDRLALDREARAIHLELKRSGHRDRFDFQTRWAAEPLDLLRELRELKPTVVHFSGHGSAGTGTTPSSANSRHVVAAGASSRIEQGGLYLQDAVGGVQLVSADAIAQALHAAGTSVKLVILNACYTAPIAEALRAHVDCVVGMTGAIHDNAARSFAIGFYGGLGEHESVAAAFKQGRAAIDLEGLPDADRPQLTVRVGFDAAQLILAAATLSIFVDVPCPYPGMRPFTVDDAASFHGRDTQIDDLIDRLRAGEREIYVIGPSGSGKSSLVAAGVLPRLARKVSGLGPSVVRILRPGDQPVARLFGALNLQLGQPFVARDAIGNLLAHRSQDSRVLLVIDQLEELFTQATAGERDAFLTALRALRDERRCAVIVTLRADFFGALMESPLWPERIRDQLSRIEVGPLRGEALREAIASPARAAGVDVDPELIERLLADAASEPGTLPLLQETMVQLWNKRADQTLSLADYEALGDGARSGLAVAVARRADATLRRFNAAQASIARRILLRLISLGDGRSDTRRQQPRAQLRAAGEDAADFDLVLQTMVDDRLLTIDEDLSGEPRVDLAHEVMITAWPTLASWLETRRDGEQQRRRLEVAAAQWVEHGRGVGGLLDPVMLAEAEAWRQTETARELGESADVAEWVATSRAAVANEVETRHRQARWLAGVGLLLLAGIAATAIWVAMTQERELQRDVLRSNAYAAHALAGAVAFHLREQIDAVVATASDPAVARLLHGGDREALERRRIESPFETIALYDRSGTLKVHAPRVSRVIGRDYAWRDYFRGVLPLGQAGLRAGYVSRALHSEDDDRYKFGIAAPIYEGGAWVGVLMATIGTDFALKRKRLDSVSEAGPMAVVVAPRDRSRDTTKGEGDYVVLLHEGLPHGAEIVIDSPRLRELRATRAERNQLRWLDPDPIIDDAHRDPVPGFEGRWLAGFAPVGDTGFVVVVQTRYDAALKPNTQLLRRLAWGGSAVILVWLAACVTFLWGSVRRRRSLAIGIAPWRPSLRR